MEEYKKHLLNWKDNCIDLSILSEIDKLSNEEMKQSFSSNLSFGTGGLREKMGVGSNRINIYTIRQASQAIANLLIKENTFNRVVIGYDTRNNSKIFSYEAAKVFLANGIEVFLFEDIIPTPLVSFAVRYLNASLGVMITASHNTKEYNGYKVYGSDGNQITLEMANEIAKNINSINPFKDVKNYTIDNLNQSSLFNFINEDFDNDYLKGLESIEVLNSQSTKNIRITYSPLHGTGYRLVKKSLEKFGFRDLNFVSEQMTPDGNFPTVKSPNPEEKTAMKMAIESGISNDSDLILATDPDCDRVGVAVKHNNEFILLTGNQIGALLVDYIVNILPKNNKNTIITTIVTSDLGKEIAKEKGYQIFETLTGFKFIGEKINEFEANSLYEFQFGYEESYGYLSGTFVRDKDGVIGSLLIAAMTNYHKSRGITLIDRINQINQSFGEYIDDLLIFKIDQTKIMDIIDNLRNYSLLKTRLNELYFIEDYLNSIRIFESINEKLDLPKSNVIKVYLKDKSWFAIRPSGTEPKMKVYVCARSKQSEKIVRDFLQYNIPSST